MSKLPALKAVAGLDTSITSIPDMFNAEFVQNVPQALLHLAPAPPQTVLHERASTRPQARALVLVQGGRGLGESRHG